ncbi:unnamed protein product [Echinostoma caproni]|uniref:Focal adhesion kinase 1 n=1 Tax=Echinostoma caproni TaxID=27848 RepID=A0A183AX37_9TREM|nr:unnamed protein product [Echinostoma caproni]
MSATAMLPPKLPPPPPPPPGHGSSGLQQQQSQHRVSDSPGTDTEHGIKYEDDPSSANLTENSMMILSQSVDSIHTLATNGGGDESEVSPGSCDNSPALI